MSSIDAPPLHLQLMLDTNILLDALLQREPHIAGWKALIAMQEFGDADLWVSVKSFTDVFYVASREADALAVQAAMLGLLERMHACSIDEDDIRAAIDARWDDFEDALVARAAEKVRADVLVTRDTKGFARAKTPAYTPIELVEHLRDEYGVDYAGILR